jgi:hypothetical protein
VISRLQARRFTKERFMQNIFKAKGQRFLAVLGIAAIIAAIGLSSLSCVINLDDDDYDSLDGTWTDDYGFTVSISNSTGILKRIPSDAYTWKDAENKGWVRINGTKWKKLKKTGDRTWTGDELEVFHYYNSYTAVSYDWYSRDITLSPNGRYFYTSDEQTWTRQ